MRADDAYFNKLVRIMATRCMTQAAYFGSGEVAPAEYYHYGLAAPRVHTTSPPPFAGAPVMAEDLHGLHAPLPECKTILSSPSCGKVMHAPGGSQPHLFLQDLLCLLLPSLHVWQGSAA